MIRPIALLIAMLAASGLRAAEPVSLFNVKDLSGWTFDVTTRSSGDSRCLIAVLAADCCHAR